jgi:hypothetical protein
MVCLSFKLSTWVYFISIILLSYGICQGVASKYYLVDKQKLTWRNNVENIFILLVLSSIVFVFGNYNSTFPNIGSMMLMLLVPLFLIILDKEYDTRYIGSFDNWDSNKRKMNVGIMVISFLIILGNLWVAKNKGIMLKYLFYFGMVLLLLITLFLTSNFVDTYQKSFVLRYWLIGWILGFFTIFKDSIWSELGSGFAFGLLIYSFSIYRDNLSFYECKEKSYLRCNRVGEIICDSNSIDGSINYRDSNWYSIIIISTIFLFILGVRSRFVKNLFKNIL